MDTQQKLVQALQLHQAGNLLEAGELYREILGVEPNNVDALNLMGVVMQAAGDLELAIDLISRATELAPDYFGPFANLGNAYQAANRPDEAVEVFRKALELNPDSPETANNLASVFNDLGRYEEALHASEAAMKLMPDFPAAGVNKGNALAGLSKTSEAIECYREVVEANPADGNCWYNLGNAHADLEDWKNASTAYAEALKFGSDSPEKHYNLAISLLKDMQFERSVDSFTAALRLRPHYIDAYCNMASALQALGRTEEAIGILNKALENEPGSPDLHWNLALISIQHGDYVQGWREYEWRWKTPTFAVFDRNFPAPEWKGEDLAGKTILISAEQGFGDAIQFSRYTTLVNQRGAKVILECRPQLVGLFETLDGVDKCIELGAAAGPIDYFVPLMSLPHLFGTTLQTIPGLNPYLKVPAGAEAHPVMVECKDFRVGFAWAGSPTRVDNHHRSCELAMFDQLFILPGISYFSLQVGPFQEQLNNLETTGSVYDIADTLQDFGQTAAAVQELDLIISVDTSVLHLAGALGKPALGLMSNPTGFLWMNDRADSAWYPTIQLLRQPTPGDWKTVFDDAEIELRTEMTKRIAAGPSTGEVNQ